MKYKVLQPSYFESFHCIGPACEDNCCHGWVIPLDSTTYEKYKQCDDAELRPIFQERMEALEQKIDGISVAKIIMNDDDDKNCPFLDNKGLCRIHGKFGCYDLSLTCFTFPRLVNLVKDHYEMCGDPSCPEVTRLLFANENAMVFQESFIEQDDLDHLGIRHIYKNTENDLHYTISFDLLRLMKSHRMRTWQKMMTLSVLAQKVDEYIEKNDEASLKEIVQDYCRRADSGEIRKSIMQIQFSDDIHYDFVCALGETLGSVGLNTNIFSKQYQDFKELFNRSENSRKEYFKILQGPYRKLLREYPWLMDNYIVNYLYSSIFPCKNESVHQQFTHVTLLFILLRTCIIGKLWTTEGSNSFDAAVEITYSFCRSAEHSPLLIPNLKKNFLKQGYDSPAVIASILHE